jgi:hypothetical protein
MRYAKYFMILGLFVVLAGSANAQVRVGVGIGPVGVAVGPAPVCTYGYYGYYPYACAPYGYYGPEYFDGGFFIGAGPWFHGFGFGGRRGFDRDGFGRGFDGRGRGFDGRGRGFDGRGGRGFNGNGRGGSNGGARGPAGNGFRGGSVGRWRNVTRRWFSRWRRTPVSSGR